MDMNAINGILSGLKVATDFLKGLRSLDRAVAEAGANKQWLDALEALSNARLALNELQEDSIAKDRTIRDLEEKLATRAAMEYHAPFYWQANDGRREGPFCQQCYDSAAKTVRLQPDYADGGIWVCKTCGNEFVEERYRSARRLPPHAETDWDPHGQ